MLTIIATSALRPGERDAFVRLAKELVDKSRREPGCLSYNLYEDQADPDRLIFVERWRDAEAIELHNASEHFRNIAPLLGELTLSDRGGLQTLRPVFEEAAPAD